MNKELKIISYTGMILCLLGLIDSIYLTIAHYTTPVILACPESKFINCAKVTTSPYSVIHGIPVAMLGLVFFVFMGILQLPHFWKSKNKNIHKIRLLFSVIGIFTIFYLVYIELYKLKAICLYCTAAHILTFLIFVITIIGYSLLDKNQETNKSA